jgi:adenylosuccinate synthase
MKHPIIIGLQYGDEGKGKITDILAEQAEWVIRFNGGANAGHTIWLNGKKVVTHCVPSGVLYPHARNYIGAGCVIYPVALRKELDEIEAAVGKKLGPDRLQIDSRTHLTLPIHLALDARRESTNQRIGTTKRGIGPTYVTKLDRVGLRMEDLFLLESAEGQKTLRQKLEGLLSNFVPLLVAPGSSVEALHAAIEAALKENLEVLQEAKWMLPYIAREPFPFYETARQKKCLLEGAQGVMLDVDHGSYPFVTSSNTIASGAAAGGPFPLSRLGAVVGIAKAYVTRVGEGVLPTEFMAGKSADYSEETGDRIRKNGHEFGATTGRPRRTGWLNLDELRHAVRMTDCTYIILSKADVLCGEPVVQVMFEGKLHRFDGWAAMKAGDGQTLDAKLERYIEFIEKCVGVPVVAVGTGTERSDLFWRGKPQFWAD